MGIDIESYAIFSREIGAAPGVRRGTVRLVASRGAGRAALPGPSIHAAPESAALPGTSIHAAPEGAALLGWALGAALPDGALGAALLGASLPGAAVLGTTL